MAVDYGEDFLQRIVGVHWRTPGLVEGGVFIAGEINSGNIHYLKVGLGPIDDHTGLPVWKNLGTLDFMQGDGNSFTGRAQGSSHAIVDHEGNKEPVFVLVGGDSNGIIMASSDGLSWQKVYTQTQDGGPVSIDRGTAANVFAVVWDENAKSFFAGAHQSFSNYRDPADVNNDPTLWECDILLQSRDGYSWSEVGRVNMSLDISGAGSGIWPPYPHGLLASHCSNRVTDSYGNGLPDGFYKYDSTSKTMIAPTGVPDIDYLNGGVGLMPTPPSSVTVTRFAVDPRPRPPSNTALPTYCVAQAGGNWVAAGGTYTGPDIGTCQAAYLVPSSEEGGVGWKPLNPSGESYICTMTGGPAKAPPI